MTTIQDFLDAAKTFTVTNEMTAAMGVRFGVKRFKHYTQSTYYTKVLAAVEAERAREIDAAVKAQEEQDRKDAMARRAADFDAWKASVQTNRDHAEYQLLVAVNRAKAGLDAWEKEKADFLKRFMDTPSYALAWCGSTFEAAADRDISQWVVDGFAMGCTLEVLTDEALRNVLSRAKSGNSRSTSTVSNLMDDATCQAWAKVYERLSGRAFW